MMYAKKQELIEKDNFFMDDEKKMKMYGTLIPQVSFLSLLRVLDPRS